MTETTAKTTRAERMAMPLARQVVRELAVEHGACIRPVQLRRTNVDTGHVDQVLVPCGNTLASSCPACADRAKTLRAVQCREGWHLEDEPDFTPDPASEDQEWWVVLRAEAQQQRDAAAAAVRTAFMAGLHRGSFFAACAAFAGSLVALVLLPARARAGSESALSGTNSGDSVTVTAVPVPVGEG